MSTALWDIISLPRFQRAALLALIAGLGLASTILAIAQASGYFPWPTFQDRAAGLFYNPIAQGEFLALTILLLIPCRLYWPILPLALGLWLSNSRGAWLALAFGLLAMFRRPLWLLVFAMAAAVAFTAFPSPSDLERLRIWQAAWSNLTFWGNGLGSFWDLWLGPAPATHPEYAHNDYLQLVFELGVFALPIFAVVGLGMSRVQAPLWPIFTAFLFMATFSMPLHIPLVAALGAFILISVLVWSAK